MPSYMMGNLDAMGGISKRPKNVGDKCEIRNSSISADGVVSTIWVEAVVKAMDVNGAGVPVLYCCDILGHDGYMAWYETQDVRVA